MELFGNDTTKTEADHNKILEESEIHTNVSNETKCKLEKIAARKHLI